MTFKDIVIKGAYDSDEDDTLNDFYIPVLSNATRYDRLAGYFSSTSLAISAKGMAKFVQNGGKMRLITSLQLSEEDQNAIHDGITKPDDVISKIIKKDLDSAEQLQKDHVLALAWMIATNKLEIKIAIPLTYDGNFYTDKLDKNSLYHQKIGILHDEANNVISFSGSVNETAKAWNSNIEEFKVFCSWKDDQNSYVIHDIRKFEKFWYRNANSTKIIDLPDAIHQHLLNCAPKTEIDAINKISSKTPVVQLRYYQNDAVQKWFESDMHGIFAMATGTGKTRTAISCIQKILDRSEQHLIVIACPYTHLVDQWNDDLKEFGINNSIKAYDLSANWKMDLTNSVERINHNLIKNKCVLTTHKTFSNDLFKKIIKKSKVNSFLIVDEVHKVGAEKYAEGLLETYNLRLGLSATPERYFDDKGTKMILNYFGGVIYKFSLDNAIREGYLVHYLFCPHVVYMTGDEFDEYKDYTKKIAIEMSQKYPDEKRILELSTLRSNILKVAKNKISKFIEILSNIEYTDHCIIYCAPKQIDEVANTLHRKHIIFHKFTYQETIKERPKLLQEFDNGNIDTLLAIKCLDEGVDVPSIKTAIILASSNNPIEFTQRRGRILRTYPNKKQAIIHDLIVLPKPNDLSADDNLSQQMIQKELIRLQEFAQSSDNPEYSQNLIQTLMNDYNLPNVDDG